MNWVKIAKFKTRQFKLNACVSMELSIQIAKFKFHQYELRAVSPNLMLAKVTHYMVFLFKEFSYENTFIHFICVLYMYISCINCKKI